MNSKLTFKVGDKVQHVGDLFGPCVTLYVISTSLFGIIEVAPTKHGAGSIECLESNLIKL